MPTPQWSKHYEGLSLDAPVNILLIGIRELRRYDGLQIFVRSFPCQLQLLKQMVCGVVGRLLT